MSEVREVLEITFSSERDSPALVQAALWLLKHESEIYVDSLVGDADYVMLYCTDISGPQEAVRGPGSDWFTATGDAYAPVYTLKGRTG